MGVTMCDQCIMMKDSRNCEWRIKYFDMIKHMQSEKQLLSELGRAKKKLFEAREELEEWKKWDEMKE